MSQDIQTLRAELKRLASMATPGPWTYDRGVVPPDGPERYSTISASDGDVTIAEINDLIAEGAANGDFIAAANPATLLALIAHIEALERQLAETQKYAARYNFIRSQTSPVQVSIHGIDSGLAIDGLDQAIDEEMGSWPQPADLRQAERQAPEWQPIETAPKDGSPLLLAVIQDGQVFDVANGHFEVLTEDEDDGHWDIRDGEPWCSYEGRAAGTYFCHWLPGMEFDPRWRVTDDFPYTHWMSRPAAPSAGQAKSGRQHEQE